MLEYFVGSTTNCRFTAFLNTKTHGSLKRDGLVSSRFYYQKSVEKCSSKFADHESIFPFYIIPSL